jgi:hypothetical protein
VRSTSFSAPRTSSWTDPGTPDDLLATVWGEAQLAADTTLLGLALGLRIALVPERGRWYADTFVIRTGGRLRAGRGYRHPVAALQAVRRSYVAALGRGDPKV